MPNKKIIYTTHKICKVCEAEKEFKLFRDTRHGGKRAECLECENKKRRLAMKDRYEGTKERQKDYNLANADNRKSNRDKTWQHRKEVQRIYQNNRTATEPLYRLKRNLRSRIYNFFRRNLLKKRSSTESLIGVSFEEARRHIEMKFTEGMSWDKVGVEIHIDHKIPLASAKTPKELENLCHITNLQPLWALDNIIKSDKILHDN